LSRAQSEGIFFGLGRRMLREGVIRRAEGKGANKGEAVVRLGLNGQTKTNMEPRMGAA